MPIGHSSLHLTNVCGNSFFADWKYNHEEDRKGLCSQSLHSSRLMEAVYS
jgi:hypothetical protein